MAYVVTQQCLRCQTPECVTVCPSDSFHLAPDMLVINPLRCVDCGLCVEKCVTHTIYRAKLVPDEHEMFIEKNARMAAFSPRLSMVYPVMPMSLCA